MPGVRSQRRRSRLEDHAAVSRNEQEAFHVWCKIQTPAESLFGTAALSAPAFAQSSVQLYGLVDAFVGSVKSPGSNTPTTPASRQD